MNLKHNVLTGNPTGNSRCQALVSRALNTSCYFGQSARSIESRCVVIILTSTGILLTGPFRTYFSEIWIQIALLSYKKID